MHTGPETSRTISRSPSGQGSNGAARDPDGRIEGARARSRSSPLWLALVGHTNTGKTSLLQTTLLRRRDIGEVCARSGTTREVEAGEDADDAVVGILLELRMASRMRRTLRSSASASGAENEHHVGIIMMRNGDHLSAG